MADVVVEIFGDKDPFKDVRNSSRQFLKVINDLIKKSELLGSTFRKELQGIEFKGLKDVQKLNQQNLSLFLKSTNADSLQLAQSHFNIVLFLCQ